MPARSVLGRAFAALFTASVMLTMTPAPSFALDPPRPLPGYRPVFVTEREPGVWQDCAWAAASMLLDKWTNGVTTVDRTSLRALSGDLKGGSNLGDIRRAFARLGLDLRWSPSGGDVVTWPGLIDRLSHGSGAILLGDYAALPGRYGRWDPSLQQATGSADDHAIYLDAYDARTKRILVMDPLAPAGWSGEWIPVAVLRAFAWHSGSALWTATTPAAADAPFEGVELGTASLEARAGAVHVRWPVSTAPAGWTAPNIAVATEFQAVARPDPSLRDVMALPPPAAGGPPTEALTSGSPDALEATVPVPATPGLYRMSVTLSDQRFGATASTAGPFNLYVQGPRAWSLVMPDPRSSVAGGLMPVTFVVANVGTGSWADSPPEPGSTTTPPLLRHTRLVGRWVAPDRTDDERAGAAVPVDVDLGPVPLGPGYVKFVDALIQAPTGLGTWRFEVVVTDDVGGQVAFAGSPPGILLVAVTAPGGGPAHE